MIVTQQDLDQMENRANQFYSKNKIITSPIWWEVRMTPEWMQHLRQKWKTKRNIQEIYIRYLCLLSSDKLISDMKYYQEYKSDYATIVERKNGKNSSVKKMAEYYWLIGIIDTGKSKNRIRLVIRKIFGRDYYELYSVIPSRNSQWYSYFDSNKKLDQST